MCMPACMETSSVYGGLEGSTHCNLRKQTNRQNISKENIFINMTTHAQRLEYTLQIQTAVSRFVTNDFIEGYHPSGVGILAQM